jgi:hypothetical protein
MLRCRHFYHFFLHKMNPCCKVCLHKFTAHMFSELPQPSLSASPGKGLEALLLSKVLAGNITLCCRQPVVRELRNARACFQLTVLYT